MVRCARSAFIAHGRRPDLNPKAMGAGARIDPVTDQVRHVGVVDGDVLSSEALGHQFLVNGEGSCRRKEDSRVEEDLGESAGGVCELGDLGQTAIEHVDGAHPIKVLLMVLQGGAESVESFVQVSAGGGELVAWVGKRSQLPPGMFSGAQTVGGLVERSRVGESGPAGSRPRVNGEGVPDGAHVRPLVRDLADDADAGDRLVELEMRDADPTMQADLHALDRCSRPRVSCDGRDVVETRGSA
jgi:hypothetical protein